jgi:hypothetical protein
MGFSGKNYETPDTKKGAISRSHEYISLCHYESWLLSLIVVVVIMLTIVSAAVMDRSSKSSRAVMGPDRRPCVFWCFGSSWSLRTLFGIWDFWQLVLGLDPLPDRTLVLLSFGLDWLTAVTCWQCADKGLTRSEDFNGRVQLTMGTNDCTSKQSKSMTR